MSCCTGRGFAGARMNFAWPGSAPGSRRRRLEEAGEVATDLSPAKPRKAGGLLSALRGLLGATRA